MVNLSTWVDLWDQSLNIIRYNESGVTLHQRMCKFLMEFGKLQTEAFAAQKKLCKKYVTDNQRLFGMENSYGDAFNEFLCVVQLVIDAEGLVSTAFELQAENDVKLSVKDEKKKFKFWKEDRNKMFLEMKNQIRIIDDEIKRYKDRYRDMVKSNEEYLRIEADASRSRADVDKAALAAKQKSLDFNRARDDYSAALNQFNIYRKDYFSRVLPNWSHVGYEQAAERYSRTQQLLSVLFERIQVAAERINVASRKLQETCSDYFLLEKDTEVMIDKLRSGYPPPGDIEFVDLVTATNAQHPTGASKASTGSDHIPVGSTLVTRHPPTSSTLSRLDSEDLSSLTYASTSLVLPPEFHCSVSSADLATFEAAGLPLPVKTGAGGGGGGADGVPTLGGTASPEAVVYAALVGNACLSAGASGASGGTGNAVSNSLRNFGASSVSVAGGGGGGGRTNLLRRFFSRSTRTMEADQLNVCSKNSSRRPYDGTILNSLPKKHVGMDDSSDFSDSSLELRDTRSEEQSAYAQTDVLVGLNNPYAYPKSSSSDLGQPVLSGGAAPSSPLATVKPGSPSKYQPTAKSTQLTNGTENTVVPTEYAVSNRQRQSSLSNSTTGYAANTNSNNKNNMTSYQVPSRIAPPVHNQSFGADKLPRSPIKARPLTDIQSPSVDRSPIRPADIQSPSVDKKPVRPAEIQWRSRLQSSDTASQDHPTSEDGSPKHFFPRQPKLRTSSTNETAIVVGHCTALYPFSAKGFDSCYFPFDAGETFYILAPSPTEDTTDWLRVLHGHSYEQGYVPTSYMERRDLPQPQIMPIPGVSGASEVSKADTGHFPSGSPKMSTSTASKNEFNRRKAFPASKFHRLTTGNATRDTEL